MSESTYEDRASALIIELCMCEFDVSEYIGQMVASLVQMDMPMDEAITALADGINRFSELNRQPNNIWDALLPGEPHPKYHFISDEELNQLKNSGKIDMGELGENIKLPYGLDYHKDETVYHCPNGATFFLDEHGRQWIKFVPSNGSDSQREHMFLVHHATDWIVRRT